MNLIKKCFYPAILTVIVSGLLVSITGCSNSTYSTFNIHEGMQPLTFEYPSQYKLVRLDLENDSTAEYTTIGLASGGAGSYSEIYVYIWNTTVDLPGARQIMDTLLANAEQSLTGYKLENRIGITIGDLAGEYSIFSASGDVTGSSASKAIYRVSCCTSGTKSIEIDMTCDESMKDITQADYDHLLDSLKLLS